MTTVNIHDAKTHFSRLIERARQGERITIAKDGVPVAMLVALPPQRPSRRPLGLDRGRVIIRSDFDDPLPEFEADVADPDDPLARPADVRALLDTHVFLWALAADERLSQRAREIIEDGGQRDHVQRRERLRDRLKAARGRLQLPESPETFVLDRLDRLGFEPLPVSVRHAVRAAALPHHHADPWDRLLVAQAGDEGSR